MMVQISLELTKKRIGDLVNAMQDDYRACSMHHVCERAEEIVKLAYLCQVMENERKSE